MEAVDPCKYFVEYNVDIIMKMIKKDYCFSTAFLTQFNLTFTNI